MSTFQDPFAGTPKAATHREYGADNATPLEKARRGEIYEENGLYGLKDVDGTVLYPAEYSYIGRCRDHVLFLEPDGNYHKMSRGCNESGYMPEEKRPYVKNGKAGFKVGDKILIPAEYDYIESTFGDNTVFTVVKDGREYYINDKGKEVLTRVREFEGEKIWCSPFWLCTNEFDYFTVESYVGNEDESNPNVVQVDGQWVELERYCKDEILDMVIDAKDDLPLTKKETGLLCDQFSYEYGFYIAKATGKNPLKESLRQFEKMNAFSNSWHFVAKVWQAPGEHVGAKELRNFYREIGNKRSLSAPVLAVGHDESLKPGEVKVLLVTFYNERCFPPQWEWDWFDKCKELPITKLVEESVSLRKTVDEDILEKYREDDFNDLICDCLNDLNYEEGFNWSATEQALDYFKELGSSVNYALCRYTSAALDATEEPDAKKTEYFLRAALWALDNGSGVNVTDKSKTPLDFVNEILSGCPDEGNKALAESLRTKLLEHGAVTYAERLANKDYYRELKLLRGK